MYVYTYIYIYQVYLYLYLYLYIYIFLSTGLRRNVVRLEAGRNAVAFEIQLDPTGKSHDILSDEGFANALYQTLRLRITSGSLHAPVCSTWVFMYHGTN